ncbi:cation transporter, partial [Micromonospora humida]
VARAITGVAAGNRGAGPTARLIYLEPYITSAAPERGATGTAAPTAAAPAGGASEVAGRAGG